VNITSRRLVVLSILTVVLFSLLSPALSTANVNIQIQSGGEITYPATNYALIPNDWVWGYYDDVPQYVFVDYNVTHNGDPSLRLQPGGGVDDFGLLDRSTWMNEPFSVPVNVGDNISCSAYIETGVSNNSALYGCRIGVDMWSGTYNSSDGVLSGYDLGGYISNYVPWNSTWTLVTISFTVPATYFTQNEVGITIPSSQVNHIEMWCQVNVGNDSGNAWISDAELYINP
jgi:hypothetical protein